MENGFDQFRFASRRHLRKWSVASCQWSVPCFLKSEAAWGSKHWQLETDHWPLATALVRRQELRRLRWNISRWDAFLQKWQIIGNANDDMAICQKLVRMAQRIHRRGPQENCRFPIRKVDW